MNGLAIALGGLMSAVLAAGQAPPGVEADGWTYAGESDTTLMLVKLEPPAPGSPYLRMRVRFEEAKPFDRRGFSSMSNVEVDEVDCAAQKTRVISNTRYAENNLKGEAHVEPVADPAWTSEEAGSFGAAILVAACGKPTEA